MKKKYVLPFLVLLLFSVAGGTLASHAVKSEDLVEEISEKSLDISLTGDEESEVSEEMKAVPGDTRLLHYRIRNDARKGYDLYARVNLYYGMDLKEETLEKGMIHFTLEGHEIPLVSSCSRQQKLGDWIITYHDRGQLTMYYTKPLVYGQTAEFADSVTFDCAMGNAYAGKKYYIEADAQAVQADHSEDAIAAEWGMFPHFENKILTRVSETREGAK